MNTCKDCKYLIKEDNRYKCNIPKGNYKAHPDVGGCDKHVNKTQTIKK